MANRDKRAMVFPVKRLADLGLRDLATAGTAEVLRRNGIASRRSASTTNGPGVGTTASTWIHGAAGSTW